MENVWQKEIELIIEQGLLLNVASARKISNNAQDLPSLSLGELELPDFSWLLTLIFKNSLTFCSFPDSL